MRTLEIGFAVSLMKYSSVSVLASGRLFSTGCPGEDPNWFTRSCSLTRKRFAEP